MVGDVAAQAPHRSCAAPTGALRFEECFTRDGFDGPYTIMYHLRPPAHAAALATGGARLGRRRRRPTTSAPLAKRHYRSQRAAAPGRPADRRARAAAVQRRRDHRRRIPDEADPVYFADGDARRADLRPRGRRHAALAARRRRVRAGRLRVRAARACSTASCPTSAPQHWLWIALRGGLRRCRKQWRNEVGQLRMDAPYCHRDFKRPQFAGPRDEGIRELVVQARRRVARLHDRALAARRRRLGRHGLSVGVPDPRVPAARSGWCTCRRPWHGTFAARGALICSFVPRPVDFHPDAIPCPYPHALGRLRRDHLLLRAATSRRARASARAASRTTRRASRTARTRAPTKAASARSATDELAVMLDTFRRCRPRTRARAVEDPGYHASFG